MTFYYAIGGGMGHLVRAYVYLQQSKIQQFKVITAVESGHLLFQQDQLLIIPELAQKEMTSLSQWLKAQIQLYAPVKMIIDTFPAGILGEIQAELVEGLHLQYMVRRLKWAEYSGKLQNLLSFEKTFLLEPIESEHLEFITNNCQQINDLALDYRQLWQLSPVEIANSSKQEVWMIVHSGPIDEVAQLVDFAREIADIQELKPKFWVFTTVDFDPPKASVEVIRHFPAVHFFKAGTRLFTAGGFNSVQLHSYFEGIHHFLPFPRKYDDQFWRVRSVKSRLEN